MFAKKRLSLFGGGSANSSKTQLPNIGSEEGVTTTSGSDDGTSNSTPMGDQPLSLVPLPPPVSTTSAPAEPNSNDNVKRRSLFGKRMSAFTSGLATSFTLSDATGDDVTRSRTSLDDDASAMHTAPNKSPVGLKSDTLFNNTATTTTTTTSTSSTTLNRRKKHDSYGTISSVRLGRRFKEILGLDDDDINNNDTGSVVSWSVEDQTSSVVDEDDFLTDDLDNKTISLQIYFCSSRTPVPIKVRANAVIHETIKEILDHPDAPVPLEQRDSTLWRLCKVDRSLLVTRIWLSPDQHILNYKLNDGDELRIKNVNDLESIQLAIPPATAISIQYTLDDTIKSLMDQELLRHNLHASTDQRYGMYYRRLGLWLDEKRQLSSYDVDADTTIEIRAVTQEFLLRVQLVDLDTRFTLKVLPSLTVADVIVMIQYNLNTRNINLEPFTRGGVDPFAPPFLQKKLGEDKKTSQYGLFMPNKNAWMVESRSLDDYGLAKNQDEVQYKVQYQPVTVLVPRFMAERRQDLMMCVDRDGRSMIQTHLVQLLVSERQTVKDVVDLFNADNPNFLEYSAAVASAQTSGTGSSSSGGGGADKKTTGWSSMSAFGLFTRGAERLKNEDAMWKVIKDLSKVDILEYRMAPIRIGVACTQDIDIKMDLDVDPSKPLKHLLPLFWRRFGVDSAVEYKSLALLGSKLELDLDKSLIENRAVEKVVLVMTVEPVRKKVPVESSKEAGDATMTTTTTAAGTVVQERNIWEEPADSPANITFASEGEGVVAAASLNKLIERLTTAEDASESTNYLDFMKTFILTYQSFTTPTDLLKKLIERYHVPRQKDKGIPFLDFDKFRLKVQFRVCNVIQQWIKKYQYDFVDTSLTHQSSSAAGSAAVPSHLLLSQKEQEKKQSALLAKHVLLMQVLEFAEGVLVDDHPALSRQIRKAALRLRDGTWVNLQTVTTHTVPPPAPKFIKPATVKQDGSFSIFSCDAEEIARQLTIMEFDLFANINPYEFLNQAWTKSDADQRAPNIIAVTKRFNEIAMWIAKSILEVKSIRARSKRVAKLIDVAGCLYQLNNFSTLMAFIAGFNKAPVTRLKHTMREVNTRTAKKLIELENIMSAESSYKNYRAKIHTVNPPCIPYIGVYLLDLTYMEDGNPNRIGSLINFSKRRLIHTLIREVQQYQDQAFNLTVVPEMVAMLNMAFNLPISQDASTPSSASSSVTSPTIESSGSSGKKDNLMMTMKQYEDMLFNWSLEREPRGAERNQLM